jgi:hypothetical protein
MFKKFFENKIDKIQAKELEDFVSRMRGLDGNELGGAVVSAYKFADVLKNTMGWDAFYPHIILQQDIMATMKVGKIIRSMQKDGQKAFAAGGLVWAHTLRAAQAPKLRLPAREIWFHLRRGFPHVDTFCEMTGIIPSENIGRFPDGFKPELEP